jgi:hypothetical protein
MTKKVQIVLLIFLVLAGLRLFFIYRQRHAPAPAARAPQPNPNFSADDYVVPTQAHAYDLKTAKGALDGKTVWVKAGNQISYYPFAGAHIDFKHPAGVLPPLEKLDVTNVIEAASPGSKGEEIAPGVRVREQQVLAVFHPAEDKKTYAVPIGASRGGDYSLYINDTFFLDDPHQLYKHWAPDTWTAIEQHQAKPGMNELQVSLALGIGIAQGSGGDYGNRTLTYDNNGHPVTVTFQNNHATQVQAAGG